MRDKNIKYIIAITPFAPKKSVKKYSSSKFGMLWILSKDSEEYVKTVPLSFSGRYICPHRLEYKIKFFDTRNEARLSKRQIDVYNEFVIKVKVKNGKIVEWLKKNP